MEFMGEEYIKLKATIVKYERFILRVSSFIVIAKLEVCFFFPFFCRTWDFVFIFETLTK